MRPPLGLWHAVSRAGHRAGRDGTPSSSASTRSWPRRARTSTRWPSPGRPGSARPSSGRREPAALAERGCPRADRASDGRRGEAVIRHARRPARHPSGPETLAALPAPQRRALESALLRTDVGGRAARQPRRRDGAPVAAARARVVARRRRRGRRRAVGRRGLGAGARVRGPPPRQALPSACSSPFASRASGPRPSSSRCPRDRRDELEIGGLGVAALHGSAQAAARPGVPPARAREDRGRERREPFLRPRDRRELERTGVPARRRAAARCRRKCARSRGRACSGCPQRRSRRCSPPRACPGPTSRSSTRRLSPPAEEAGLVTVGGDGGRPLQPPARRVGRLRVGAGRAEAAECTVRSPGGSPIPRSARGTSRSRRPAPTRRPRRPSIARPSSSGAAAPSRSRPS